MAIRNKIIRRSCKTTSKHQQQEDSTIPNPKAKSTDE